MRALVVGAAGQVGAALVECLAARGHVVVGGDLRGVGASTRTVDLTDARAVARLLDEVRPDWLFCPAGLTHVDHCEDHPEEARRVNGDAPAAAAELAAAGGAGFVFYSTDYVFDGACGPYGEDDPVHPLSVYGRSKLEGERAVTAANPRAVVVRTTGVYGPDPQGKNFVYQLLRRGRAGEAMRVPADQVSNPTYNLDLAAASVELAERGLTGVWHLAGADLLDRHAFARVACEVFGLDPAFVSPVATSALGQRAARPLRSGLRIDRAREALRTPLRGARAGLEAMRAALGTEGGA